MPTQCVYVAVQPPTFRISHLVQELSSLDGHKFALISLSTVRKVQLQIARIRMTKMEILR
jgi:hypothetical protein